MSFADQDDRFADRRSAQDRPYLRGPEEDEANWRERLTRQSEDAFSKLVDDLAGSSLIGDTVSRLLKTGERAVRAQEGVASALRLPTASDLEKLGLRIRAVSDRLEEIEDLIDELEDRLASVERKFTNPDSAPQATPPVARASTAKARPAGKAKPASAKTRPSKPKTQPRAKTAAKPRSNGSSS